MIHSFRESQKLSRATAFLPRFADLGDPSSLNRAHRHHATPRSDRCAFHCEWTIKQALVRYNITDRSLTHDQAALPHRSVFYRTYRTRHHKSSQSNLTTRYNASLSSPIQRHKVPRRSQMNHQLYHYSDHNDTPVIFCSDTFPHSTANNLPTT